jgi:hypothetical protein
MVTTASPGLEEVAEVDGASGALAGVIAIDAVDVSDVNAPLFARTVNVTAVPLVRPETLQTSGFGKTGVIVQVCPLDAVTV